MCCLNTLFCADINYASDTDDEAYKTNSGSSDSGSDSDDSVEETSDSSEAQADDDSEAGPKKKKKLHKIVSSDTDEPTAEGSKKLSDRKNNGAKSERHDDHKDEKPGCTGVTRKVTKDHIDKRKRPKPKASDDDDDDDDNENGERFAGNSFSILVLVTQLFGMFIFLFFCYVIYFSNAFLKLMKL